MYHLQKHIENGTMRFIAHFLVMLTILQAWKTSLITKIFESVDMSVIDYATAFSLTATGVYYGVRAYIAYRIWRDNRNNKKSIIITEEQQ